MNVLYDVQMIMFVWHRLTARICKIVCTLLVPDMLKKLFVCGSVILNLTSESLRSKVAYKQTVLRKMNRRKELHAQEKQDLFTHNVGAVM